jgi:hypothetical protein
MKHSDLHEFPFGTEIQMRLVSPVEAPFCIHGDNIQRFGPQKERGRIIHRGLRYALLNMEIMQDILGIFASMGVLSPNNSFGKRHMENCGVATADSVPSIVELKTN